MISHGNFNIEATAVIDRILGKMVPVVTLRDRNLLLAEVRDCTISGPRNPVVVCFTSPLSSLTVI